MSSSETVVFILLGQSNAVGHNLPMKEQDKIKIPLNNVFGLKRSLNQSYNITKISWDNYISSEMNLAEEQDDTYSIANCLAHQWQQAIDGGKPLPDLYIVHIAVGAQGVTKKYMWNPDRKQKLIPGALGTVDISLHSFTKHILSMVNNYMEDTNKRPYYLLHWRGGEEDIVAPKLELRNSLKDVYEQIFNEYCATVKHNIDIKLHRIITDNYVMKTDPGGLLENLKYINSVFEELSEKYNNISILDPREYPGYSSEIEHCGVFLEDDVHFTSDVNKWIASGIIQKFLLHLLHK